MLLTDVPFQNPCCYVELFEKLIQLFHVRRNIVVKVLDIQGKIAKTVKQTFREYISRLPVDVNDLQKGRYVINIFNNNDFVTSIFYTKH